MKLTTLAASLAIYIAPIVYAQFTVTVTWDTTYDDSSVSMDTVTCSAALDPPYSTFGSLPSFPYIGAAAVISSSDTAECGTCWELQYETWKVAVMAIKSADDGFVISMTAANDLTDHKVFQLYSVQATATQVNVSVCAL